MDEILVAGPLETELYQICGKLVTALQQQGFHISPEKVQLHPLNLFLGFELYPNQVLTQKAQIRTKSLHLK